VVNYARCSLCTSINRSMSKRLINRYYLAYTLAAKGAF